MIVTITSCAPVLRLQEADDPPQMATAAMPAMAATRNAMTGGIGNDQATQPAAAAPQELAAAADVEHAHAEREGDAETGRDQRGRERQRVHERSDLIEEPGASEVPDRALEQRRIRATHRVADRDEEVVRTQPNQ